LQEGWQGVSVELAKANQPAVSPVLPAEQEQPEEPSASVSERSGEYYQDAVPVTSRGWSA